jgi:uncharacterized protein (DUF2267 family)
MDYDQFVGIVQRDLGQPSRESADSAAQATFQTLAERFEFVLRVAKREGVDETTAERHARAVFAALGRAIDPGELGDLIAELPEDFGPLVAEAQGRFDELMPADEFVRRVAERAGLDFDAAGRAVEAVLQTLAERLAPGEVDDLNARVARAFHPALKL